MHTLCQGRFVAGLRYLFSGIILPICQDVREKIILPLVSHAFFRDLYRTKPSFVVTAMCAANLATHIASHDPLMFFGNFENWNCYLAAPTVT
jgi:hypothetical protein